jgi:hypothetical protein
MKISQDEVLTWSSSIEMADRYAAYLTTGYVDSSYCLIIIYTWLESCTGTIFCTRTRPDDFFLYPSPNRTRPLYTRTEPDPAGCTRTRTGTREIFLKTEHFSNVLFFIWKELLLNFIHKQQWRRDYLRFSKKTNDSSESGFSCCFLASKTRPASLNIRSRVEDEAGTESSGDAKHDNCGYIHECFFYHSNTSLPAW